MLNDILHQIIEHFGGDFDRAHNWLISRNAGLGNVTPLYMILVGREDKLKRFIKASDEGSFP